MRCGIEEVVKDNINKEPYTIKVDATGPTSKVTSLIYYGKGYYFENARSFSVIMKTESLI